MGELGGVGFTGAVEGVVGVNFKLAESCTSPEGIKVRLVSVQIETPAFSVYPMLAGASSPSRRQEERSFL